MLAGHRSASVEYLPIRMPRRPSGASGQPTCLKAIRDRRTACGTIWHFSPPLLRIVAANGRAACHQWGLGRSLSLDTSRAARRMGGKGMVCMRALKA